MISAGVPHFRSIQALIVWGAEEVPSTDTETFYQKNENPSQRQIRADLGRESPIHCQTKFFTNSQERKKHINIKKYPPNPPVRIPP